MIETLKFKTGITMIKSRCKEIIFIALIFANITACSNPVTTKNINNKPQQTESPYDDNKICHDSSVACENINENQTFSITLPEEKNSQKIELKFNKIRTLTGKEIEDYSEICNLNEMERREYYLNMYFKKQNNEVILEKFTQQSLCPDTTIALMEFYDMGNISISEIKDVPYQGYKESIDILEGHSYAIKQSLGYVDFSIPEVKSYIYVEKINEDSINIILNSPNNK